MDKPTPPALPVTSPGDPSSPSPPPSRWSTQDFVLGFFAVPASLLLLAIPIIRLVAGPAFLAVFVFGLVWGISKKRWAFFLGSMTCVLAVSLILLVVCLVNPPNFH